MSSISEELELIFNGLSGTECEAFIRAVRKHAFSIGKARDPGYMADYASTCMDGPALRWYDELDSDTQSDWNKLRSALLTKYTADYKADIQPSPASNTSSAFIPTPAAAPPAASHISAPPVPAAFMFASVNGVFENTPSASVSSWRPTNDYSSEDDDRPRDDASSRRSPSPPTPPQLFTQQAMTPQFMGRASSPSRGVDPPQSIAPQWPIPQIHSNPGTSSPPGQVNPPRTAPAPVRRPIQDTLPRLGRIVVQVEDAPSKKRYLRAKLNQVGFFKCTTSTWNCLRVLYAPLYEPSIIRLLNCNAPEKLLGIAWDHRNGPIVPQALGPNSILNGNLCAVSGTPVVTSSSTSKSVHLGYSGSAVWHIDPSGYIQAVWTDSRTGGSWPLDVLYMGDWIYIAGNADSFMRSQEFPIYQKARLYFEAV